MLPSTDFKLCNGRGYCSSESSSELIFSVDADGTSLVDVWDDAIFKTWFKFMGSA